ncbi:hypothetical protein CHARACLAT_021757 [Characodon lateralis]|uniref:Uncharacterized protein n=1 Tax=Characodon lateralis TaxID=208331 RepID=A0ABU7CU89_9TELE|nr:hypothetical protein [Characodon lateralis]
MPLPARRQHAGGSQGILRECQKIFLDLRKGSLRRTHSASDVVVPTLVSGSAGICLEKAVTRLWRDL